MPSSAQTRSKIWGAEKPAGWTVPIFAVVSKYRVDLVGERLDDVTQERCSIHLTYRFMERDEGELRDAIDCEEHADLAVRVSQLATVDVNVADRRLSEASALRHRFVGRQTRDAVTFEPAMLARTFLSLRCL